MRKTPSDGASSLGRLPKGTVVTLTGEAKEGFVAVEVELEDGSIEGWVPREVLNRSARKSIPDDEAAGEGDDEEAPAKKKEPKQRRRSDDTEDDEAVSSRPRTRVRVPKDEGILLRRESTFFYGIQGQGGYSVLQTDATANNMAGFSFGGGGHVGYYLSSNVALRFELGYVQLNGVDPNNKVDPLSFGYLDSSLYLSYYINDFELYGGLGYFYGLSLSAVPKASQLASIAGAADLSTLVGAGGLGYRVPLNEVAAIIFRGRFTMGFVRSPIGVSIFHGLVFLEFRG